MALRQFLTQAQANLLPPTSSYSTSPCGFLCNSPQLAGEATGTHSQGDQLAHPNSWMDNRGSSDGTSTRGQRRYTAKNQGKRLHECHFCPYTSCRLFNLVMHKRIHTGEKPFKCSVCPSAFTQPSNLKRHMRSKHTDKKPFACRLCSSAFRYKLQLEKHVERQHT
ncbi:transcription factor Ken-like [Haemaphysalis longicornis]